MLAPVEADSASLPVCNGARPAGSIIDSSGFFGFGWLPGAHITWEHAGTSYLPLPILANVITRLPVCYSAFPDILRCRAVAVFVFGVPGCARHPRAVLQPVLAVSLILAGFQVLSPPGNTP